MSDFFKDNSYLIPFLTGSVPAFFIGLLVSHLKREKKWLGYSISSRNIVKRGHANLSMKYDQREIKSLDSHEILLRNVGNKPLVNLPVSIQTDGELVEHSLTVPSGMKAEVGFVGNNGLRIEFDLINRNESVTLTLTVADSKEREVKVIARDENLIVKTVKPILSEQNMFKYGMAMLVLVFMLEFFLRSLRSLFSK